MEGKETVYVIGHKNPDTDSVCSAISGYNKHEKAYRKQFDGTKVQNPLQN